MRLFALVLILTTAPAMAVAQSTVNPDALADWVGGSMLSLPTTICSAR